MNTVISNQVLTTVHHTIAITRSIRTALTNDRARAIYRTIGNAIITACLMTVALGILARDLYEAYGDWSNSLVQKCQEIPEATEVIAAAVETVREWLQGMRDRTLLQVQGFAADTEMAARAKVERMGEKITARAIPVCSGPHCKIRRGFAKA
jgi:hypothetical protein